MPLQTRLPVVSAYFAIFLLTALMVTACGSGAAPTSQPTPSVPANPTAVPTVIPKPTIVPKTATLVPASTSTPVPTLLPTNAPAIAPTAAQSKPNLDQPAVTTGCGKSPNEKPGVTSNITIAANPKGARGSSERSFLLHLPAKYNPNQPAPVLLVFHGHGGTAADMEQATGFSPLADRENFIAVYPQGIKDDDGLPMWASVGPAADYNIDDLTFTSDLLNKLQSELCVDAARIYATGFSNGGGMSHYLACRLASRIAGVVPISGNYFDLPDGGCQPSRAVSLLEIHGTADDVIYYNGRPDKDYPGWPLPPILDYVTLWAKSDGCTVGPQTFLDTKEVQGIEYTSCWNNSLVAHYKEIGVGHVYPDNINGHPAREVIWSFLAKHILLA